ncbi:uncharacterized protein, putative amidase [Chthonomonas calidirosea]|uniref:Uncharacterized protein, putative amidase n=1 Tax=Chthonomonas calidirosea (strain DSM 23976 / ICMP 18418 / T49) TaxID=1303518 RepID=S0ETU1_CHTCT|nr:creatininase family protein [Chthonomonas calidirosea]CCW34996.1 Uncharacterized protein, putative amidase [Chthonomonas calidirosea T49]CEK20626.1 uncharacterized protein, putative amidase [Chthonomonas calidirosea]CEK20989.1 uncharacterized protein, putative amidase [Chthonomonas calidirosea]
MQLGEKSWPEAHELADKVVVLPLGSFEQHGHHLPLLTDTLICTEIARRAEAALGDAVLFLPVLWVGASDHHRAFPGTISVSNELYVALLCDMIESLIGSGFRKIFLLNAHGGNITPGRMAIYRAQMRHKDLTDLWIALGTWWTLAADAVAAVPELQQLVVSHACEQETSMILCLRPELVRRELATGANIPFESAFYCPDFSSPSRVDVPRAFDQLSQTGAFGHPELATQEKGEALFQAVAEQVVSFLREFATWPSLTPQ